MTYENHFQNFVFKFSDKFIYAPSSIDQGVESAHDGFPTAENFQPTISSKYMILK